MKRGGPQRRTALRADAGKTRAWQRRSREAAITRAREAAKRVKPLRRKSRQRPEEGPLSREEWQRAVYALSDGCCIVTGTRVRDASDHRLYHHVIPKQVLRRRGLHHLVWDKRNGVLVTPEVHANHETAFKRIPAEKLPQRTRDFAVELGPWAEDLLDRFYPATGSSRSTSRGG